MFFFKEYPVCVYVWEKKIGMWLPLTFYKLQNQIMIKIVMQHITFQTDFSMDINIVLLKSKKTKI
jgi:hypothetical protein